MPAAVISIGDRTRAERSGWWSLLELATPGHSPEPLGILLADAETDEMTLRLRNSSDFEDLEEQEMDLLDYLADDLRAKSKERGAALLFRTLEDSLSHFLRISDRTAVSFSGPNSRMADRLFDRYVDSEVRPFVTHLPLYTLQAAATKFGESMDVREDEWVRAPEGLRITDGMFVAQVVGRSMEPLIPDGSFCVFRGEVTGSRAGRRLLIEKFDETDFAARYTVKRYTSNKSSKGSKPAEAAEWDFESEPEWEHTQIRLEPLNPEFSSFTLSPDAFRVVGEFVAVLPD